MRWQIEVVPRSTCPDSLGHVVLKKLLALEIQGLTKVTTARLYLIEGEVSSTDADRLARELFQDPVVEDVRVTAWDTYNGQAQGSVSVFRKPGVMDPVEAGILRGASRLNAPLTAAATGVRYTLHGVLESRLLSVAERALANPAIEIVQVGSDRFPARKVPLKTPATRREVLLTKVSDAELERLSSTGGLSLTLLEMQAIQQHFLSLGREPTDIELESLAQTWSEHCKHKTFTGTIRYKGPGVSDLKENATIENLLKRTIKEATHTLNKDWCLSVFHDNAGVIALDGPWAICFKVETHNHPSAIEPYGGAGTGLGGVIRDVLGTGLGARPVANTNVFCVAPPDLRDTDVPKGALHPLRVLRGVVAGVRDYGNQMGIPTVNGAVLFDERYVGNPLVYCGTIGLLPKSAVDKRVTPGEAIVVLGGRTGRDGVHGATFSSAELHQDSETVDSGAVQIGNAITEKKVLDVVLQARDLGLFTAITDCGAGGFSSAVGEMGAECGARVHLESAPLKYAGLSPTEIWISESQERMVVSVPKEKVQTLLDLAASEDVLAFVLGEFTDTKKLELFHGELKVGEIGMDFLHDGVPRFVRDATYAPPPRETAAALPKQHPSALLLELLASPNIASKEWIIRQYDHEVRAGTVVKPLVGRDAQGPSDAAVMAPIPGQTVGFAVGCGMNPWYGDLDPYAMACAAIDEALRNVVSVGGDPGHCAILDNFSWGNCSKPDRLGGLVRAAYGCKDAALALETPFISGKDSLNNEYKVGDRTIVIPPSLLISALARVPDVRHAVTMDLKRVNSYLYVVGTTSDELGGSLYLRHFGQRGAVVPHFDGARAKRTFRAIHQAQTKGLILSCHDPSDGGLAVALAEMVLASGVGAEVQLGKLAVAKGALSFEARLWSESLSRFILEVAPEYVAALETELRGIPFAIVGKTTETPRLRIYESENTPPRIDLLATDAEAAFRDHLSRQLEGQEVSEARP